MKFTLFVAIIWIILICIKEANSANILALFTYAFSSPYFVVVPYVNKLIENGHNLTIITTVKHCPTFEGVRYIRVQALDNLYYELIHFDYDQDIVFSKWKEASLGSMMYYNVSRIILRDPGVQSLLHDENEHFDVVLMDPILTDALLGIAEHFDAMQVGISVFGRPWLVDYTAGDSAPSIYVPVSPTGYARGFDLIDKWYKWMHITEEWLLDQLIYLPTQRKLFLRYFPQFSPARMYYRRRNFSLILVNQHFNLGRVRSSVPNVIEVAGMHLAHPTPELDVELLRFLDEAEHGVIYFSMGMEIMSRWLFKQPVVVETFSRLKQRIVWKHELEALPNKSDNVYLSSQVPQRRLLEHSNVKLFITHGGLLSIIEAANAGVPLLGLPMYFDQFDNMDLMRRAGVAQVLDPNTLTIEVLTNSINALLNEPQYMIKAKELSVRFQDQPTSPLDKAIWWTEYVIRHKGAPHMRMPEEEISFMPYYCLHMLSVLLSRIGLTALVVIILWYRVLRCLRRRASRRYYVRSPSSEGSTSR